jgi:hypothetical protein
MSGAIPPPQYAFMAWCLVKYRNNFTFYLYLPGNRPPAILIVACNFTDREYPTHEINPDNAGTIQFRVRSCYILTGFSRK